MTRMWFVFAASRSSWSRDDLEIPESGEQRSEQRERGDTQDAEADTSGIGVHRRVKLRSEVSVSDQRINLVESGESRPLRPATTKMIVVSGVPVSVRPAEQRTAHDVEDDRQNAACGDARRREPPRHAKDRNLDGADGERGDAVHEGRQTEGSAQHEVERQTRGESDDCAPLRSVSDRGAECEQ